MRAPFLLFSQSDTDLSGEFELDMQLPAASMLPKQSKSYVLDETFEAPSTTSTFSPPQSPTPKPYD